MSESIDPLNDSLELVDIGEAPPVRRPGDYRRRGAEGPPLVLDPAGKRNKNGTVKSVTYGRPSGFHRWVDNGFALERWSERMVLCGAVLLDLDVELDELDDRELDELVQRAKRVAGADLAARRGTAAHEATHRLHDLERAELDVIANLGELGFTPGLVAAVEGAYLDALERWDLRVLASECKVVDDLWRLAGTADRFVELGRDLRFGDRVIPAGTVVVLDLKTGALRIRSGEVLYWSGYTVQLRSYAHGCLYVIDGDDEHREPFPWPVLDTDGLILHLDIAGALDTDVMTASLWHADLTHGWRLGELAARARDASRHAGAFAQLGEGPLARTVDVAPSRLERDLAASLDELDVPVDPVLALRAWLQARIDVIGRLGGFAATDLSAQWPAGVPALRTSDGHTPEDYAAIEAALDRVETKHSIPFGPARPGGSTDAEQVGWLSALLGAFPNTTIHDKGAP